MTMTRAPTVSKLVRFDAYEVDLAGGQLYKRGVRISLREKSFQVLAALLEHPGEVVTREELRRRLWPEDVFVDFDNNLNTAVARLREALGDSAERPRFIETLPKHGYRFMAHVFEAPPAPEPEPAARVGLRRRWVLALALLALPAVLVALLAFNVGGLRDRLLGQPAAPKIDSLAVLPLKNLMGDPEQEYFVEGMHEALIAELSRISPLKVISRTSTMQYKKGEKPLPQVARELKVDGVIEGSVLREGDQVRISVQLIHGPSDRHLWTQSFDRNFHDILTLQRDVARAIAGEIRVRSGWLVECDPNCTPRSASVRISSHPRSGTCSPNS